MRRYMGLTETLTRSPPIGGAKQSTASLSLKFDADFRQFIDANGDLALNVKGSPIASIVRWEWQVIMLTTFL